MSRRLKVDSRESDLRPVSPHGRRGDEHPAGSGSWDIAAAIFGLVCLIVAIARDTDPARWWFLGIGLLILLVDSYIFVSRKRWLRVE
jgi:hypothetical protein